MKIDGGCQCGGITFEAEIDPATGGLRAFRDLRSRVNRIGQQLVYNPGSRMEAREVRAK